MLNLQYLQIVGHTDPAKGLFVDATSIVAHIRDAQNPRDAGGAPLQDFGDDVAKRIVNLAKSALAALPADQARPAGDWTARITLDETDAIAIEWQIPGRFMNTPNSARLSRAVGEDEAKEILEAVAAALTSHMKETVTVLVTLPNRAPESARIGETAPRQVFADSK